MLGTTFFASLTGVTAGVVALFVVVASASNGVVSNPATVPTAVDAVLLVLTSQSDDSINVMKKFAIPVHVQIRKINLYDSSAV